MSHLRLDEDGSILTVTIDRAPVNALTFDTYSEIAEVFSSIGARSDVRSVILTGAGSRAFCAGVDLKWLQNRSSEASPIEARVDPGLLAREAFRSVYDCAVPVVAAVNGPALGAGLALAAVCDLIVAAETATFGAPEINAGVLGASSQLSLLVGRHKARELYFLGEPLTAADLQRCGALYDVVPLGRVLDTAHSLAERLAKKSPIAMRLAKEAMNRVEFLALWDAYRLEQDYTNRLLTFEDSREARLAFLEKRAPQWSLR